MNKSILVIDTPSNCEECELLQHASFCYTGKNVDCHREDGKPKWCPLRPIPAKAAEDLVKGLDAMEKMQSVEVRTIRRTE